MNIKNLSAARISFAIGVTEFALANTPTGNVTVSECQTFQGAPIFIGATGPRWNPQEGQSLEGIEELRVYVLDDSGSTLVVRDAHGRFLGRTSIRASQHTVAEGEYSVCGAAGALRVRTIAQTRQV